MLHHSAVGLNPSLPRYNMNDHGCTNTLHGHFLCSAHERVSISKVRVVEALLHQFIGDSEWS
jgi:hypothetical protein